LSDDAPRYPYYRYDFRGTLRLRFLDWAWLGFLARHVLFVVVLAVSSTKGQDGSVGKVFGALVEPWFLIADVPAILLLTVAANRVPKAGWAARFVWRHGRWFVALSVLLYAGILAWLAIEDATTIDPIAWASLAASVAVAFYAWFGRYPKDLFASFPARGQP
jgi:hypothetical protein